MKEKRLLITIVFISFLTFCVNFFISQRQAQLNNLFLELLVIILPLVLILLHSRYEIGFYRIWLFIILGAGFGLLFEIIGINFGVIFGGSYYYLKTNLMIFNVPVFILSYWAFFIYSGYCLTNSFLTWFNLNKPSRLNRDWRRLAILITADGFFVTLIDLFMDPIQSKIGLWQWPESGIYFGVPLGNFIGWFIVAILASGIYRIYEYKRPLAKNGNLLYFNMIPVLGYMALTLFFFFYALKLKLTILAFTGLSLMLPVVIINLLIFKFWYLKEKAYIKERGQLKNTPS